MRRRWKKTWTGTIRSSYVPATCMYRRICRNLHVKKRFSRLTVPLHIFDSMFLRHTTSCKLSCSRDSSSITNAKKPDNMLAESATTGTLTVLCFQNHWTRLWRHGIIILVMSSCRESTVCLEWTKFSVQRFVSAATIQPTHSLCLTSAFFCLLFSLPSLYR